MQARGLLLAVLVAACTGGDGASSLVRVSDEPAGANCAAGGVAIASGVDDNGDGALDDDEVTSTSYVCDSAAAAMLVDTADEPAGANCAAGGTVVRIGPDSNGDGTLEATEVTQTVYVCNGAGGTSVLVATADAGAGCAAGGTAVYTGVDDDGDGVLDAGEIDTTTYVCNGATALIATEDAGGACAAGGTIVHTGVDDDGDGVLEPGEYDSSTTICNGGGGGVGPVLYGNYTINNSLDEDLIVGVTRITGSLTIQTTGLTDVSLPNLVEVDGDLTASGDYESLSLPALAHVVGNVNVSAFGATLDLHALHDAGRLQITSDTTALAFPQLASVNEVSITAPVTSLDLGAVTQITEDVTLSGVQLTSLDALAGLSSIGALRIYTAPSLTSLGAIAGVTIDSITVSGSGLTDLAGIDQRTTLGGLSLSSVPLSAITLGQLTSVGGLMLNGNPALTRVDLPNLGSIGSNTNGLMLQNDTQLSWFTAPALTAANGGIYVSGNPLLPTCHMSDVRDQIVAHGNYVNYIVQDTVPCVAITWCRLQYPLDATAAPGDPLTYYGRYYAPGFTNQSPANQSSPVIRAAIGVGADGSAPGAAWAWTAATANPTWDGNAAGEYGNDEWQASVIAPAPGTYDTAFRVSGDAGRTWMYCDRNAGAGSDGAQDGYQVANAGGLIVN